MPQQRDRLRRSRNELHNIFIGGQAKVHLGDNYSANHDIFNLVTAEQRQRALLNLLDSEGVLSQIQQYSRVRIPPDCFAWVQNSRLAKWLVSPNETLFWISGCPGSGKSTLMKHLTDSFWTLRELRSAEGQADWEVVYFHFGYGAGRNVVDQMESLAKSFLIQLDHRICQNSSNLIGRLNSSQTAEDFIDVLTTALRKETFKVCAFIDSLDEFDGEPWDLFHSLIDIQQRTGMKMCLASRAEASFTVLLSGHPSLCMHEQNGSAIFSYVKMKVMQMKVHNIPIHNLFTTGLQHAICRKASGVILWACLVVDEMMKACDSETSTDDLWVLLDTFPTSLDGVYERILHENNSRFIGEAAVVAHLLAKNGGFQTRRVLYSAWFYLRVTLFDFHDNSEEVDVEAFNTRIIALLGNLVEFDCNGCGDEVVKIAHKSLTTFLARADWLIGPLPKIYEQDYSDAPWHRLFSNIVLQTAGSGLVSLNTFDSDTVLLDLLRQPLERNSRKQSQDIIPETVPKPWRHLFLEALHNFPDWCGKDHVMKIALNADSVFHSNLSIITYAHMLSCVHCKQYVYNQWWDVSVRKLRAYSHLVIYLCHQRYDCLNLWLRTVRFPLSSDTLSSLLDLTMVTTQTSSLDPAMSRHRLQIFEFLGQRGHFIQGRHLCALDQPNLQLPSMTAWCQHQLKIRPNAVWDHAHHDGCRYLKSQSDFGLMCHWCKIKGNSQTSLEIFLRSGHNVDSPCCTHGSPLHIIFTLLISDICQSCEHHVRSLPMEGGMDDIDDAVWQLSCYNPRVVLPMTTFWYKFIALTQASASPHVVSKHGNVLDHARRARNCLRAEPVTRMLDQVIAAIEHRIATDEWPQFWPHFWEDNEPTFLDLGSDPFSFL